MDNILPIMQISLSFEPTFYVNYSLIYNIFIQMFGHEISNESIDAVFCTLMMKYPSILLIFAIPAICGEQKCLSVFSYSFFKETEYAYIFKLSSFRFC